VPDTYVLPVKDESGAAVDVALSVGLLGYSHVVVYDEFGVGYSIPSVPPSEPPTGEFPVYDETGSQFLIPFGLQQATGLYERSSNAIRSRLDFALTEALRMSVQYDNMPDIAASPGSTDAIWARVAIDFEPEEHLAIGGSDNRYRARGDAIVELRVPLQLGDDAPLSYVTDVKNFVRDVSVEPVTFLDPWHSTVRRDGAWWRVDVHCPFRAEDDIDKPQPQSHSNPDSGEVHDTIRDAFDDLVATPQGVTVAWDNAVPATPDDELWCSAAVLTGSATTASSGTTRIRRQVGIFKVKVCAPLSTGDRDAWRFVDVVCDQMRAASIGGVCFAVPSVHVLGRQGRWWQVVVDLPFRVDEVS
jgi:hypothetical protein